MSKTKGFTLIELVIVIVILGILSAIVVPRFVNLKGNATVAAGDASVGAVKSAFAIAIADKQGKFPTITDLVGYIQKQGGDAVHEAKAVPAGIVITISGSQYLIRTFTNSDCTTATTAVGNEVQCVGTIAKGAAGLEVYKG